MIKGKKFNHFNVKTFCLNRIELMTSVFSQSNIVWCQLNIFNFVHNNCAYGNFFFPMDLNCDRWFDLFIPLLLTQRLQFFTLIQIGITRQKRRIYTNFCLLFYSFSSFWLIDCNIFGFDALQKYFSLFSFCFLFTCNRIAECNAMTFVVSQRIRNGCKINSQFNVGNAF